MSDTLPMLLARVLRVYISLSPWAAALYLHYWLEHGGHWAVDMAFRPLVSAALLALGMLLSFVLHSALAKRSAGKH